ncbi:hypothetical protein P7K49_018813 [Saguinus oedipus]|uniref:Uncharacterized protein n=1 Tax=Saguinus oedipus TaxID=9490 RepID=A0ABQ9V6F5_SAGOE|nr:hypothetical protein P7K49_018813 [Saguinus oedipus]
MITARWSLPVLPSSSRILLAFLALGPLSLVRTEWVSSHWDRSHPRIRNFRTARPEGGRSNVPDPPSRRPPRPGPPRSHQPPHLPDSARPISPCVSPDRVSGWPLRIPRPPTSPGPRTSQDRRHPISPRNSPDCAPPISPRASPIVHVPSAPCVSPDRVFGWPLRIPRPPTSSGPRTSQDRWHPISPRASPIVRVPSATAPPRTVCIPSAPAPPR